MILKPFQSWPLAYRRRESANSSGLERWGVGWGGIVSQWFIAVAAHTRTSQAQFNPNPSGNWATASQDKVSSNLRKAIRILKSLMDKKVTASPAHYFSASAIFWSNQGNVLGVTYHITCWKLDETKVGCVLLQHQPHAFHYPCAWKPFNLFPLAMRLKMSKTRLCTGQCDEGHQWKSRGECLDTYTVLPVSTQHSPSLSNSDVRDCTRCNVLPL